MLPASSHAAGGVAEFERTFMPAPASVSRERGVGAAGGGVPMVTLKTGREFDLVGFRWHGQAPRIDVQSYGIRGWSRWTTVETTVDDLPDDGPLTREGGARKVSGPVWTGRATALRVRVRGSGSGRDANGELTAHFVKVSKTAASGGGARAVSNGLTRVSADESGGAAPGGSTVGGSMGGGSTGGGPTGGGSGKGTSNGTSNTGRGADVPPAPAIVTRSQWGADRNCKPRVRPSYGEVLATLVHHTVSTNEYSQAEAAGVVLGICRYHRNSNSWNDIGYNLLVDRFGTVYEGRSGGVDRAVVGAHAQGYNGQTAGIAMVGTFTGSAPPTAALDSLQTVLSWKLALAGITRNERVSVISTGGKLNRFKNGRTVFVRPVSGHRDLGSTACPGNGMFTLLPGLAGGLDQNVRLATRLSIRLKRVSADDGGESVTVSGRARAQGAAVSNQPIEIQAFDDSIGWVKIGEAQSDATGFWQATVRPLKRQWVRGAFLGDAARRPGRSMWLFTPKLKAPPVTGTRRR